MNNIIKNGGQFNVYETTRSIKIKKIGFNGIVLNIKEWNNMIRDQYLTIDDIIVRPKDGVIKYLSRSVKEFKVPAFIFPSKYINYMMSDKEYSEISEMFAEWVGKVFNDENSYWLQG